jgi:hypothetical protein
MILQPLAEACSSHVHCNLGWKAVFRLNNLGTPAQGLKKCCKVLDPLPESEIYLELKALWPVRPDAFSTLAHIQVRRGCRYSSVERTALDEAVGIIA